MRGVAVKTCANRQVNTLEKVVSTKGIPSPSNNLHPKCSRESSAISARYQDTGRFFRIGFRPGYGSRGQPELEGGGNRSQSRTSCRVPVLRFSRHRRAKNLLNEVLRDRMVYCVGVTHLRLVACEHRHVATRIIELRYLDRSHGSVLLRPRLRARAYWPIRPAAGQAKLAASPKTDAGDRWRRSPAVGPTRENRVPRHDRSCSSCAGT